MKNLSTGLLTVLCATAFSIAQPTEQPYEQTDYQQVAPTSEAPAYVEQQAEPTAFQDAQPANPEPAQATAETQPIDAAQATSNDPMPIDELAAPVKKKAPISVGVNATFIYGYFWGFEDLTSDGYDNPTGIGGEFGLAGRFTMAEGLQFSPEISFRIFNVSHKDDGDDDSFERCYNQMFIDIALYLRGVLSNGFFLEIAPQVSINTSAEYTIDGVDYNKHDFGNIEQSAAEFGLNVGAGYYILDNLSLSFRWYMGFNEVFPDVKYKEDLYDDPKNFENNKPKKSIKYSDIHLKGAHTMMFKFGATYWFI